VRQDGCFAEKQEPHPALLLIVHSERLAGLDWDASLRQTAEVLGLHKLDILRAQ
jgi:hypothetical protein